MAAPVVVVGVNGSERSVPALVTAVRLAAVTGNRIVAVHVVHSHSLAKGAPVSGAGALAIADDEATDRCHMDCELVLAGADVAWQFEVRHGDPVTELARAATDHDALCVTIGRSVRRRLICGSHSTVSERLVHQCDRPVLIVPSQRERTSPHAPIRCSARPARTTWSRRRCSETNVNDGIVCIDEHVVVACLPQDALSCLNGPMATAAWFGGPQPRISNHDRLSFW